MSLNDEPFPIDMLDDPADEGKPTWQDLISVVVLIVLLIGLGFFGLSGITCGN